MTTSTPTMISRRAFGAVAGTTIAALALLGAAAPASAQTYTPTPSATFSDATPEPGQTVAVSGNAVAGATVVITLTQPDGSTITLGTVTADATGAFSLNVTLPSGLVDGNYLLTAVAGPTILSSSAFAVAGAVTQGGSTPTGAGTTAAAGNNPTQTTPTQTTPTQTTTLPVTGNESGLLVWAGAGFLTLGGAALVVSKVRSTGNGPTVTL